MCFMLINLVYKITNKFDTRKRVYNFDTFIDYNIIFHTFKNQNDILSYRSCQTLSRS